MSSGRLDTTSRAERHGDNSSLQSFFIYCPTLSRGKEERAMDNILFFYPSHVHPNAQMNKVGFCIGAACLMERFSKSKRVDKIRMSDTVITLFSPFPDLWIAVETRSPFHGPPVLPILQRGFDAFVLRYGSSLVSALVSHGDCGVDVAASREALRDFYKKFAVFLETHVLLLDIRHAVRGTTGAPSVGLLSLIMSAGNGTEGNENPNMSRWARRWVAVASAESRLAFPAWMRSSSRESQFMCHSLASRRLSSLSPGGLHKEVSGGGCDQRSSFTIGWGQECGSAAVANDTTTLGKTAEERLSWTCCEYVVFIGETLELIASNASSETVSRLICLLFIESDVTDFAVFAERGLSHCYVCHVSGVIVAILVDASLHGSMHDTVLETCNALAADVANYLTSDTSKLIRGPTGMQQRMLTPSPPNTNFQTAFKSFFFSPNVLGLQKEKLTPQWTIWHSGMLFGSPMREYPLDVQVALSTVLCAFIRGLAADTEKGRENEWGGDGADARSSCTSSSVLGECDFDSLCMHVPSTATEVWVPLHHSTWLCVRHVHSCVCGLVFHNSAPLRSCFEAASEFYQSVSFML